jgi:hypothetical protein
MSHTGTATISIPGADPFQASATWGAATGQQEIPLTDAETYDVDLAMMPSAGVQMLLVTVGALDGDGVAAEDPVRVNLTPGGYVMLPPRGGICLLAPGVAAGVTGLQLVSSKNALVKLIAYG